MLIAHRIETIEDLDAYRDDLNQKIDRLGTERKELRNLLKRHPVRMTSPGWRKSKVKSSVFPKN